MSSAYADSVEGPRLAIVGPLGGNLGLLGSRGVKWAQGYSSAQLIALVTVPPLPLSRNSCFASLALRL
eukprot:3868959-Pyramimonas_sp.AAC.1